MRQVSGSQVVIHVVLTPNFNISATMGFVDPFRAANYLDGKTHFQWKLISERGGACVSSNGASLLTTSLEEVMGDDADIVIVSSSWAPEHHATGRLQSALRHWARRGATIGALDTGAFILARAGLLNGRRATVHYEHIDALTELFPAVEVSENLFVFDDNRISCSGGTAAVDFRLHPSGCVLAKPLVSKDFMSVRRSGWPTGWPK